MSDAERYEAEVLEGTRRAPGDCDPINHPPVINVYYNAGPMRPLDRISLTDGWRRRVDIDVSDVDNNPRGGGIDFIGFFDDVFENGSGEIELIKSDSDADRWYLMIRMHRNPNWPDNEKVIRLLALDGADCGREFRLTLAYRAPYTGPPREIDAPPSIIYHPEYEKSNRDPRPREIDAPPLLEYHPEAGSGD